MHAVTVQYIFFLLKLPAKQNMSLKNILTALDHFG